MGNSCVKAPLAKQSHPSPPPQAKTPVQPLKIIALHPTQARAYPLHKQSFQKTANNQTKTIIVPFYDVTSADQSSPDLFYKTWSSPPSSPHYHDIFFHHNVGADSG